MGKTIAIVVAAIIGVAFVVISLFLGLYGISVRGGTLAKGTGMGGSSGCYVSDQYFTDTSAVANEANIISQIQAKWPTASDKTTYLQQIFDAGKQAGLNPLIPIGIWLGEQTFNNPEKAFGYGYTDSGTLSNVTAWDAQLKGAYLAMGQARDGTGSYTDPANTNMFTRLFYNYTTALRNEYTANGNSWIETGPNNSDIANRLAVFHLVASSQLTCQTRSTLANNKTGNNGVPLIKQADYKQMYGGSSTSIATAGCCVVSAAMVLQYYSINVDPVSVSGFSYEKNCYIEGDGTNTPCLFSKLSTQYSLGYESFDLNWGKAISYLSQKKPLLAHGKGSGPFTKGGHCIVITGYDPSTKLFNINNPAGTGDGPYSQDQLIKAGIVGMYYLGK